MRRRARLRIRHVDVRHPSARYELKSTSSCQRERECGSLRSTRWLKINLRTLPQPPINQLPSKHRVRLRTRGFEVFARFLQIAGAAVEFAEGGVEEVVVAQGILLADFAQGADACYGASIWATATARFKR